MTAIRSAGFVIGLLLAAVDGEAVARQARTAPAFKLDWVDISYVIPKNEDYQPIYRLLKKRQALENIPDLLVDFVNAGGEMYISGNPPYLGSKWQTDHHKADLKASFA